jgi:hypothetical protein
MHSGAWARWVIVVITLIVVDVLIVVPSGDQSERALIAGSIVTVAGIAAIVYGITNRPGQNPMQANSSTGSDESHRAPRAARQRLRPTDARDRVEP